ncbi:related to DnaJ protein [Melanopsichium pennsylvanicum]|uniref:Related to DnaJ protein n=2 Tax=Melanopsichium pennsylvanicum TaxID=63383 RepID=A0AAJ4XRN8_9BASI|nr:related to DnaJ protein [Melanopsichium pennsylvanicum 4]SNX87127.1 related to DnaJ protein [Melanopsichium pennsylvanicum]
MDDQDPGLQFFPDGNIDLYGTLVVAKQATQEEIKKAYKKLALKFHPDKVLSSSSTTNSQDVIKQFQKIGFAYAVLSDEVRRRKFDNTGSTAQLMFGESDDNYDWNEYFKELWTGQVSRQALDDFKKKYQNSVEEKQDILAAYQATNGDLAAMFDHVPCCEFIVDEKRFITIIDDAIKEGEIKETKEWGKSKKDEKSRKALREKAKREAHEAEKLAKELGVWDDLFGSGKAKVKPANASDAKNGAKPKGGKKAKAHDDDDRQDDLAGLTALIQRKNQNRVSQFDDMIAKLEAKAGVKGTGPSDEEFDRIQAEMMARKKGANKENRAKRGAASAVGAKKKSKN